MIPLSDTITSTGVVTPATDFKAQKLDKAEFLRTEILSLNPDLARRVISTSFVEEVKRSQATLTPYPMTPVKGSSAWETPITLPMRIFSFGAFLSMKEGEFATESILKHLSEERTANGNPFASYEALATQGWDAGAGLG